MNASQQFAPGWLQTGVSDEDRPATARIPAASEIT